VPFTATFIVLALGGLVNAVFLTYKHFQHKPLVCPINHDCNAVVESKWGHIFGVRNEILGLLFYGAIFLGGIVNAVAPLAVPRLNLYLLIGAAAGLGFSIFLTLLQKFVIKDYCFYCLISAAVSLLLFLNSLALYF